jgi:hypothetical protein
LPAEPIVLLASRGNCPFQRKAAVAESIDESVKFLFVYNYNMNGLPEEEDTLVPMYSQFGNTRLVLLSLTHRAGVGIKKYLSEQSEAVRNMGGPIIRFDAQPPAGIFTAEDVQSMLLSAIGLFFMLISFMGCMLILAGTYGHMQGQRIVFAGPEGAGGGRRLLTEEEVHSLTTQTGFSEEKPAARTTGEEEGQSIDEEGSPHEEEHSCAVCIDDFTTDAVLTVLPCGHKFHTDCIVPWLTERQSKCPLCKFDVLEHIRERRNAENSNGEVTGRRPVLWDRLFRYRWTHLTGEDDGLAHDRTAIAATEMELEAAELDELELTEQRPPSSLFVIGDDASDTSH